MDGSSSSEGSVGPWRGTVSHLSGKVQSVQQPAQVSRVQGSHQSVGDGGAINHSVVRNRVLSQL